MSELAVHDGLDDEAVQQFREEGFVAVSGLVRPSLAIAAADEVNELFGRPRRLTTTSGQISVLNGADLANTASGVVLHRVSAAGQTLGLRLRSESESGPKEAVQVLELTDAAREPFVYSLGSTGVAALVGFGGEARVESESEASSWITTGTVAFLRHRPEPYSVTVGDSGRSLLLHLGGVEAHPVPEAGQTPAPQHAA